ncbi:uncharacterized protein MELLADRAFT_63555 [Melampsora larici-populina 98AG31]|uniref:Uncharacterized protein n=1 Tax=Melampsora larici-populina (strain 98AG31 / pathotype 3-4-7) TaxID=747676 RepID=F4RN26_MELLP|nr:uncharacterized protein MELLADRAFT_63555 [Melampsora larici-populina 98AG31]EGG06290.1 hypothetical protein MELLADRAFT_63555 [Melampsora larici-populina 98AG31]
MNQDRESDIENSRLLSNQNQEELDQEEEADEEEGQISRIFQRDINPFESNLIILSLICLCLGSIGFGLFAGEVSKLNEFKKSTHRHHDNEGQRNQTHTIVVTKTVTAPFGNPTDSPPWNPKDICFSDSCIDAAGELRKGIDWDAKPCEDFNQFTS